MRLRFALAGALCGLVAITGLASGHHPLSRAPRCPVFPSDNHWNQRVDRLPVAGNSDAIVRSIGRDAYVHADFGSGRYQGRPIGIPYTTVSRRHRRVRVRFQYADESDRGPYPIPRKVPIEGGRNSRGDRHVIVGRPRPLPALRAVRRVPGSGRSALARRLGRGLEPALQRLEAPRLDLGRCGGPSDPAGAGTVRGGAARRD